MEINLEKKFIEILNSKDSGGNYKSFTIIKKI